MIHSQTHEHGLEKEIAYFIVKTYRLELRSGSSKQDSSKKTSKELEWTLINILEIAKRLELGYKIQQKYTKHKWLDKIHLKITKISDGSR
jgi:hypothetical protein